DQALKISKDIEYRKGQAEALFAKSLALGGLDRRTEAVACARQALDIFEQIESPRASTMRELLAEWRR
ncbi:MAG TPA: hypothetical protein PLZ44_04845, partial [Methanothrix sp.]|nr:hypothetical protein [Methanothrix sp.]